jgi:FkbH-like protein
MRSARTRIEQDAPDVTTAPALHWLPENPAWRQAAQDFRKHPSWAGAVALANARLDFVRTNMLDGLIREAFADMPPDAAAPVRLAVLGSATLGHLLPGIRVAALRRNMHLTAYEGDYGQYRQALGDPEGGLRSFGPTAILFAFDPWHLTAGVHPGQTTEEIDLAFAAVTQTIAACWRTARENFGCTVLQQTILPALAPLLGNNEHRLPGSRAGFIRRLNGWLRDNSDRHGVQLVALDERAAADGLAAWHDVALWHRAKQEISPAAAPIYGELVARALAAVQGRSFKCLVLDLDNTIWGGVVGDDGIDGLVLGQGSAAGEAFLAVQSYAKDLSERGVILAVCSKNDEANVLEAFDRHPDMILKRGDIACFAVNWADKATNLRTIAAELNIGLDALVFLDDNPAERDLIRRELPMVAVPEVGDDPALYPRAIADAGYFESADVTDDDRERNRQYRSNRLRDDARVAATDMPSYLKGLEMRLLWRPFDAVGLPRIVQLINKTNQFNLTTRRYSEKQVSDVMADPKVLGLQIRLVDKFGDNGIVAIVIGRLNDGALEIDTWLMSCRVLGRQVEAATLNLVAELARRRGATRLIGEYRPTAKNGIVRDHYRKLGFAEIPSEADGQTRSARDLSDFTPLKSYIAIEEA